jgi:acyl-CoA thioesterase-1
MLTVTLVVLWLASGACSPGSDSDVVRSARQEGSTPSGSGASSQAQEPGATNDRARVVFMGTSLTAGYGLDDQSFRFTDLLQAKVDSASLPFTIVNAGVSGDTSAGGLRRIGWLLRAPLDVLVIELGANDGLRGLPVETMRGNLQAIIDSARVHHPDVQFVIAGMEAPPNLGLDYRSAFGSVFRELAQDNEAVLIPFLLNGVAGRAELNQVDGIHPTVEGHRLVSETIWEYLGPLLQAATPTNEVPS